jgi:hypothetical protein
MNKDLIESIVQYQTTKDEDGRRNLSLVRGIQFFKEEDVVEAFFRWLCDNDLVDYKFTDMRVITEDGKSYPALTSKMKPVSINVAGKNFASFDKLFLERLPRWQQVIRIRQRIIDPSVMFTNWNDDETLPNLQTCKERAKIEGVVTHNALEDAWDVIQLLRTQY